MQSTVGSTYYEAGANDVQSVTNTQGATQRYTALLEEQASELGAHLLAHPASTSGNEPPGIPEPSDTLKVTKWKSGGIWHYESTPKANLEQSEWETLHAQRVAAAKIVFPEDS